MFYDGILGFQFDEIKDEATIYTDKARRVATLTSEDANGMGDGNVTAFFDLISGSLITINERIENTDVDTMLKIDAAVEDFNNSQKNYVAVYHMSDDSNYIDVNVTSKKFSAIVEEAMG